MFASEIAVPDMSAPGIARYGGDLQGLSRGGRMPMEKFSGLVGHLVRLRSDGALDDREFSDFVRYAAALFVEAEAVKCIDQVLDDIPHQGL